MDFIGFDLGKVFSQVCIITEDGELIECRIRTDRDHLAELLGSRPPARILVEASTESEWVARHLEGLGHEVVIVDPNFASMYATRSRKVKTDKRDARTLAEACRLPRIYSEPGNLAISLTGRAHNADPRKLMMRCKQIRAPVE